MAFHEQTLTLIREITNDGQVTDDEVVTLATFLNEKREARKSWPGIAVFDILKDVLADRRIDEVERRALQVILEGIEVICAGQAKSTKTVTAPAKSAGSANAAGSCKTPLRMPDLDFEHVQAQIESPEMARRMVRFACDCDNWMDVRSSLPDSSPGRACRCLVRELVHLFETNANIVGKWPRQLVAVIRHAGNFGRGLDPVENWRTLKLDQFEFIISSGKTSWCNVYEAHASGEVEKFSYHRGYKRWGHGASPRAAKSLELAFAERTI